MPKFPSMPRVSIVIPIGRDLAAFESTLISVLEQQPPGAEVLVAHDGSYSDPFELCDEVQFVVADSGHLVDLVAVAASAARGRFVHVLADGVRATNGWMDGALEKFEHFDAACVAPVIRNSKNGKVVSAGWFDGSDRLCKNACQGRTDASAAPKLIGAHLQASFWRRDVLRSLGNAYRSRRDIDAGYAYERLLRTAGWRSVLASECELLIDQSQLPWDVSSFARGQQLRAIRNHFSGNTGWGQALTTGLSATLANLFRPGQLAEALGQACAPTLAKEVAQSIDRDVVSRCDEDGATVSMPARQQRTSSRRAA
ncbi:MAG: glycosyltransferase family 2 protein [Rubripirellula sp.]